MVSVQQTVATPALKGHSDEWRFMIIISLATFNPAFPPPFQRCHSATVAVAAAVTAAVCIIEHARTHNLPQTVAVAVVVAWSFSCNSETLFSLALSGLGNLYSAALNQRQ